MNYNRITGGILDSAFKVHTFLGPGLLESVYLTCLAHELRKRAFKVEIQVPLPVHYDGIEVPLAYRIDLVVEDSVIVEIKAVEKLIAVHEAQLLSYLRLAKRKVGLIINFHEVHLRDGIRRLVNNF